jgi:rod shape-determining protein MreC
MLIYSRYTWWIAAMLALAMFLGVAGQVGVLNPFQGLFLRMTGPVESLTLGIFEPVATVLSGAGDVDDLQDQNDRLRIENEELRNRIAELEQDTARLEELEQALGVSQEEASVRLAANVVTRDLSSFAAVVRIDKGASDGIRAGMVVVSAQGTLLGTVTKALEDTSFVRLVTDTQSRVNARAVESSALGVVKGTPNRGLSFDLGQGDLKVGDIIVTSGLGGNYPEGIVIGRVSEVSGNSQDLFQKVTVEPGVRGSTAQTVFVRTDFVPQRLEVGE